LFTIVGGKWTTYRRMGEHMVDKIETKLNWQKRESVTRALQVHGSQTNSNESDPLAYYGSDEENIRKLMSDAENVWLSNALHIHKAQVIWAVVHEMARTVEDVLARRTRALLLDAKESLRISESVAQIMAESMKKDQQWVRQQVNDYASLVKNYILI